MQRATLGKSSSETASQLQGRIARAFSNNSLVNINGKDLRFPIYVYKTFPLRILHVTFVYL